MAKRKLGRGLDLLIARGEAPPQEKSSGLLQVSPTEIEVNPNQPRKRFAVSELETLKTSIARDGILQPLIVRQAGDSYQLIAGERRLRAARELSLDTVPVLRLDLGDERLLEVALVENIHRENLNPIELAEAYKALMDSRGWTQEELADQLGMSRPAVSNTVRLLELSEDMQQALVRGQLTAGHAKVLLSITDEKLRRVLFERIGDEKLSVRELELAKDGDALPPMTEAEAESSGDGRAGSGGKGSGRKGPGGKRGGGRGKKKEEKKPYLVSLEEELTEALGTRVQIREKSGKGAIAVEFYSKEDFEKIRRLLLASH